MLAQVVAKIGLKAVGAAGSAIAKTGKAFGMAGKAISESGQQQQSSSQPAQSSNNVITGNFGMAGSAGQQKITGGGTLPAPKAVAKPQVSTKMPTEKLLDTAVKYLTSIDKSLKSQLELERRTYQEQAQLDREAIIENKPATNTFIDIKNRLSGFKSDVKDNVSSAVDIAKFAVILGGAAALIASALDEKQLDALKENVEQFKKKFGWLGDLAAMIPAGGIFGFLFGGKGLKGRLRGGMIGIIAEAVATVAFNKMTGEGGGNSSAVNIAAVGGIGYLGYRGAKSGISTFGKIKDARTKMANLSASKSYYDPNTGRMRSAAAGKAGQFASTKGATGFLKSPRWQKFLNWLTKNGKRKLVTKIQQRIAVAVTSGAIAATGIGAAFGAIGFLLNLGFSLYLMYEIYELWKSFTAEEDANKSGASDAEIVKAIKEPNATKVGGTTAGYSTTSATNGQNKIITSVVDGGSGYTTVMYSDGTTERRGGTLPARTNNPGNIEYKDFAKSYGAVGSSPSTNGPPVAVFPTREAGFVAMDGLLKSKYSNGPIGQTIESWATDPSHPAKVLGAAGVDPSKSYTDFTKDEKVRFMQALAKVEGFYAAGSGPSFSSSGTNVSGMVNSGAEQVGKIFGMLGSAVIKPGVARNFTPSGSNVSEQINNESMNLQNDITFGIQREKSKDKITSPTIPAGTPRGARLVKSVSYIDPNYQNINVLNKYLAHFRMAS